MMDGRVWLSEPAKDGFRSLAFRSSWSPVDALVTGEILLTFSQEFVLTSFVRTAPCEGVKNFKSNTGTNACNVAPSILTASPHSCGLSYCVARLYSLNSHNRGVQAPGSKKTRRNAGLPSRLPALRRVSATEAARKQAVLIGDRISETAYLAPRLLQ